MSSENNKRIAKNTLLLYFRMFIIMGVSLYTSRLILKTLGVIDFGIYNVVAGVVSMLSFFSVTMTNVVQRYFSYSISRSDKYNLSSVYSTSMQIQIALSLLLLLICEIIGIWYFYNKLVLPPDKITSAMWVFQLSILQTIVMMISIPYTALIIAYEKMSAFAYISIFEVTGKLLIVYLLSIFNAEKLILYALLMFLVQLIIRLIYVIYCKRTFKNIHFKWTYKRSLFKEMLSFAGWNTFGVFSEIIETQGINLILNLFFGPAVNAARGITMQVMGTVRNFSVNFLLAVNPQIIKSYAGNDLSYMSTLIFRASKFAFILLYIISLPIIFFVDEILELWLVNVPNYTSSFVRIVLCTTMLTIIIDPLKTAIYATGKVKYVQLISGFILLMNLPIAFYILKNGLSANVVFYVELILYILIFFVYLYFIQGMAGISFINYLKSVIFKLLMIILFTIPFAYFIKAYTHASFTQLIVNLLLIVIESLFVSFLVGLNREEKSFVMSKINKRIK